MKPYNYNLLNISIAQFIIHNNHLIDHFKSAVGQVTEPMKNPDFQLLDNYF